VFLIIIGIIGFFVAILCAEILQNELKKCTKKRTKRQLRRSECCDNLSQLRFHPNLQETTFVIPIKAIETNTVKPLEAGNYIPPSYQELGNENDEEQHIPLLWQEAFGEFEQLAQKAFPNNSAQNMLL